MTKNFSGMISVLRPIELFLQISPASIPALKTSQTLSQNFFIEFSRTEIFKIIPKKFSAMFLALNLF